MCAVSAMHDYFREHVPMRDWTPALYRSYQEVIAQVGKLDRAFSQPDCEDPGKAAWMKAVEERLAQLEEEASILHVPSS